MVGIVKPTKIITKDGECEISISIELNINLNNNVLPGQVETTVTAQKIEAKKLEPEQKEETAWVVPDFTNMKKVQFGKET